MAFSCIITALGLKCYHTEGECIVKTLASQSSDLPKAETCKTVEKTCPGEDDACSKVAKHNNGK